MSRPATLTLQDVADIARVARPVVSVWRKRAVVRGEIIPFPASVQVVAGVEHFDPDQIVDWLRRTGRGNSTEVELDARALALSEDVDPLAVEALLALAVASGRELGALSTDELAAVAREMDPHNAWVQDEVAALGTAAPVVCTFVDELVAVSYGPQDAWDRLMTSRLGRRHLRAPVADRAVLLLVTVLRALGRQLDADDVGLADSSPGESDLTVRIVRSWGETTPVHLVPTRSAASRRTRRLAFVHEIDVREDERPTLRVLDVVAVDPTEALTAIDDLQLELTAGQAAVVFGTSALLCDALADRDLDATRAHVLRSGALRLAARLPRRLRAAASRQSLALWVLAPAPPGPVAERRIALADLTDDRLDAEVIELLGVDAVAAVVNPAGHAFGAARLQVASTVTARRELVPRGTRASAGHGRQSGAEWAVRIDTQVSSLTGLSAPRLSVTPTAADEEGAASTTIDAMLTSGEVRLVPGLRIDRQHAHSVGSVRVIEPAGNVHVGFDPIDLAALSTRAARTEPGDVVFASSPVPIARVDTAGGHVVLRPARVLRLQEGAQVGPHALALAVNRQPPTSREWRAWPVPVVPAGEQVRLESHLAELSSFEQQLLERAATTAALARDLTDALASAAVRLDPTERT